MSFLLLVITLHLRAHLAINHNHRTQHYLRGKGAISSIDGSVVWSPKSGIQLSRTPRSRGNMTTGGC